MKQITVIACALFLSPPIASACNRHATDDPAGHDFILDRLPGRWDEGLPLGNGMIGALIWQRDTVLRMSLDRADLWDLRPVREFEGPEFRFSWVIDRLRKGEYGRAQEMGDLPYNRDAAPTKLPPAAIEFPLAGAGEVRRATLRLADAFCRIEWKNGMRFESFVAARRNVGFFRIYGAPKEIAPVLVPPPYAAGGDTSGAPDSGPSGNEPWRLGYPAPRISRTDHEIVYHQECRDGFSYTVRVSWAWTGHRVLVGMWTIRPNRLFPLEDARAEVDSAAGAGTRSFEAEYAAHRRWWARFWARSSIEIPDTVLERQWYREMYKFGSASRRGAPPVTLQAVWTADNGRLPPWKGDFHHDLNTELSYWPAYGANHLEEGRALTDWLWWCKPVAEKYTRTFFGTRGLNFPGVSTLTGEPMGGWIQYSLSPTISAWLAQHFYLQWRYSLDTTFLRERAYPWIREVALYLDDLAVRDSAGRRSLPLSSSPEINDNRVDAWFASMTNYDVALVRWLYGAAAETARDMGRREEAARWSRERERWPALAVSPEDGRLLVAPGIPLGESHRHFSHLMAISPLGLLDPDGSEGDRRTIAASLADLGRLGTDWWCGYSFAWLGSLRALAREGEQAAEALRTFSTCFCLSNSFHANGDQSGTGRSKFTYRPFTLEGNFAFAQGIQQMLLQSHGGRLRIFPALPASWEDASFTRLRGEGALLVSAVRRAGGLRSLTIHAEKGGTVRLADPFAGRKWHVRLHGAGPIRSAEGILRFDMRPGGTAQFSVPGGHR